ncbi:MAG: DUF2254 domain-containing protein [Pseudomonadota bacterium]
MTAFLELPRTLARKALEYWRELWVRVVAMGMAAILALALTYPVGLLMPDEWRGILAGEAADRLLNIIANAMLAVTTFSLTVMVTVFRNASAQWTPRIHRLAMADPTTQNTLATFIGTYVYALLAIILRELGIFSDDKALTLFGMTVLILIFMLFSLIRWVLHLQTFGSLLSSTREIEEMAVDKLRERLDTPCLGAVPWDGVVPIGAEPICAQQSGYVQHIYQESLNAFCETLGVEMRMEADIGDFVSIRTPLVWVSDKGDPTDAEVDRDLDQIVRDHIVLGDVRTHDQDPRFGLVVLSEIGSKALSPGINDPGTAIDVLTRLERILNFYEDETKGTEPVHDRLLVRPLEALDLLEDGFAPIVRDGAGIVEVQICVQQSLKALRSHPAEDMQEAALTIARRARARAGKVMEHDDDIARLDKATDKVVKQAP